MRLLIVLVFLVTSLGNSEDGVFLRDSAGSVKASMQDQEVYVSALEAAFRFTEGESIATEISQKYSLDEIKILAERTGFTLLENFTDSKGYFVDSIWEAKGK